MSALNKKWKRKYAEGVHDGLTRAIELLDDAPYVGCDVPCETEYVDRVALRRELIRERDGEEVRGGSEAS